MTKKVINTKAPEDLIRVGAAANDKKGDSLRSAFIAVNDAFDKVDANFTELYTALGLNADTTLNLEAFEFTGSTIGTTDSTAIVIDQATTITSDLTVGGDIVPSIANGGNLGSLSKPFKSLYVSTNTVFLGGVPLSLEAGTNELKINNVPISQTINFTDITGQSSLYKPESIEDYRSESYYNSAAVPANAVIIDHVTYLWATDSARSFYRDTVFQPSSYSATIDGSGNITNIQITTARSYPNPDTYPNFDGCEIVNTDNMVAIDSGIDITNPAAIAASSIFEILNAGVTSISKPVPTDLTDLTDLSGLLSSGTGDITFTNTTVSAPNDEAITVQAKDNDGVTTAEVHLDPANGQVRLTGTSEEDWYDYDNGDWDTAVWTLSQLSFTNAPNIVTFLGRNDTIITGVSINEGDKIEYDGSSADGNNIGIDILQLADPDPTTITSFRIYYRYESRIEIDNNERELNLIAHNLDINIQTTLDIDLRATGYINVRADNYAQLQSNNNYIWVESTGAFIGLGDRTFEFDNIDDSPRLKLPSGGDIVDSEGESVLVNTGAWAFSSNVAYNATSYDQGLYIAPGVEGVSYVFVPGNSESATVPIQISNGSETGQVNVTAHNKVWEFDANGDLTLPPSGDILDSTGTSVLGGTDTGVVSFDTNTIYTAGSQNLVINPGNDDLNRIVIPGPSNGAAYPLSLTNTEGSVTVTANTAQWTFAADGKTTFPSNKIKTPSSLSIETPNSTTIVTGLADWNGDSLGGWDQPSYTNLATTSDTGTGLTVDIVAGSGYIDINSITINNPGSGYTDGDVITINNENNFPGTFTVVVTTTANTWDFGTDGTLTFPDDTEQTTAWTGILPNPTYSGSNAIGEATPAPLNLNNSAAGTLLTQLNLINTGGAEGAGSAIDFWTYTSINDVPEVRLQAVDDGDYSADFAIKIKATGNGGEGSLTTSWTFGSDGNLTFPDNTVQTTAYTKVIDSWTVATGTNTYSITVPLNGTYQIWVSGNIPNGIITYTATVLVTNPNVPAIGTQYAWNYTGAGNPILLTAIPDQIRGTAGVISTDATYAGTTSNRFDFTIANTSGSVQTVNWGYTILS